MNELLIQVSKILQVSVDTLQTNGKDYVLEYARFAFTDGIFKNIIGGALLSLLTLMGLIVAFAFLYDVLDFDLNKKQETRLLVVTMLIVIIILAVVFLSPLGFDYMAYKSSPFMYGLQKIIKLAN